MTFTTDEKKFLTQLLNEKLNKIKNDENMANQAIELISGEYKYQEFIENLIKKLK